MPVLPVCLVEPVWQQFVVLVPTHPVVAPPHPLGCQADRVVVEHVAAALVHGSGDERIATPGCSDRTIRRRVQAWAEGGLAVELHRLVLAHYDRMIGIEGEDIVVDGCIPNAPCGGDKAGRRADRPWIGASRDGNDRRWRQSP